MAHPFLPYGRQVIEDDDIAEVVRVLRGDMLTTGPEVPAFEAAFARKFDAAEAVACNSGTAALHLAVMAKGLKPGDKVIVPSITFLATANAVRLAGAEVVFADVDERTGLMTAATVSDAFDRAQGGVKAVIPVHLAGRTASPVEIADVARAHGADVIEDACHALGTRYSAGGSVHRTGACAHSIAAAFSLHPVKTIAAGEGGVVTTNDAKLAERMRRLRSHGMTRQVDQFQVKALAFASDGAVNPWYYEMAEVGLNYRLTDFQAALARSQLAKLDRFAAARARIASVYDELVPSLAPLVEPMDPVASCEPVLHLYQVHIDFAKIGRSRAAVMEHLKAQGIGTQVHYIPVHRQPYYASRYPGVRLPAADAFYARTLSLPLWAGMVEDDAQRVVAALGKAIS